MVVHLAIQHGDMPWGRGQRGLHQTTGTSSPLSSLLSGSDWSHVPSLVTTTFHAQLPVAEARGGLPDDRGTEVDGRQDFSGCGRLLRAVLCNGVHLSLVYGTSPAEGAGGVGAEHVL